MMIKEFRVVLPLQVEDFQRGQLFSVARASKQETGGGEGVEVVRNVHFQSDPSLPPQHNRPGQYTHKIYYFNSKVPTIIRKMAPEGSLVIHEQSWNAYPYCKTVLTNPDYMKDNFKITIETLHLPDNGSTNNALNLSPELLKQREILKLDIASNDHLHKGDMTPATDPKVFRSKKTNRGPLQEGKWQQTMKPVMCAYKLVTVYFKMFPISGMVESLAIQYYPRLFAKFHREAWCWVDDWFDLTMEDIRRFEQEIAQQLAVQRQEGPIRGMAATEE